VNLDLLTDSYDFSLPKEQIALKPLYPADSAKLLVYDRTKDVITHTVFREILNFIPKDTAVILNNTKVIKARIFGKKESGGKVELLLNKPLNDDRYLVYIRGKIKVDTKLYFDNSLSAQVAELLEEGARIVQFYQNDKLLNFEALIEILNQIGHMPLPPYINRDDTFEDEKDYQTLFAQHSGSVAAPTASLHFTDELLQKFKQHFEIGYLTLHVGAGTFKPVEAENILEHPMHSEYFSIDEYTKNIIEDGKNILAVGTTVTRTVEYYARKKSLKGECDLFLHPQNRPIRVNHLLTNFHLPKSTLIMLVASFIGREKTLELYEEAVRENYRFYSYGDTMLII
jgi:S-adenosylmethionine:tRNA ribosyltransferase-isomerase